MMKGIPPAACTPWLLRVWVHSRYYTEYMSTEATWQTSSTSSDETEDIAEKIGRNVRGGEVIELVSDVGGGKTAFVRGLAEGMGSPDKVSSPTFTISKVYNAGKLKLLHFDFYRLHEAGLIEHELAETINHPENVIVIEWGDIVQGVLPLERMTINIKTTGATNRELNFVFPESLEYLLKRQE